MILHVMKNVEDSPLSINQYFKEKGAPFSQAQYHLYEKSKHLNRGGRRGTQRVENALAFLRVIYGSIKMKTNKKKSWERRDKFILASW
ncbi:MAG: hypothetical protein C5S48_02705 [Candidatus Methanogaster sp.]|nr:MAG: hypothetical protein C5S48_02705 [ANME-2 cluster archaeon]